MHAKKTHKIIEYTNYCKSPSHPTTLDDYNCPRMATANCTLQMFQQISLYINLKTSNKSCQLHTHIFTSWWLATLLTLTYRNDMQPKQQINGQEFFTFIIVHYLGKLCCTFRYKQVLKYRCVCLQLHVDRYHSIKKMSIVSLMAQ